MAVNYEEKSFMEKAPERSSLYPEDTYFERGGMASSGTKTFFCHNCLCHQFWLKAHSDVVRKMHLLSFYIDKYTPIFFMLGTNLLVESLKCI